MSDDIQKINTISGGQNAQNVHGNQIQTEKYIENQNNILIHNQNFIEITYKKGKLNNLDKVIFLLLNTSTITTFKIIDFDNILSKEAIDKYCSDLICILDYEFKHIKKYNQNWNELRINKFIKKYLFKIENLKNLELEINEFKNSELYNIVFDFLLTEKIKYNKMPDTKGINLTMEFYEKHKDFDIYKFFGYEINRLPKLNEIINDILGDYFLLEEEIKNWNNWQLEYFFNSFNGEKTYNNLKLWLKEKNIKSNLIQTQVNSIDDLFDLALNGYFKDEDSKRWKKLQEHYLKYSKSPNAAILELFLKNHKSKEYTMENLHCWLKKNNIQSDLINIYTDNSIGKLFDLVFTEGYFTNENATFWSDLQNIYFR